MNLQLRTRRISLAAAVLTIGLAACDQVGNRYEISKDQAGRTLRLDKRTGEVSVIEGERIVPIRAAKDVEAERIVKTGALADAKTYPALPLPQFGAEATLKTSWQDGKLLYAIQIRPPRKESKPTAEQDAKGPAGQTTGSKPNWPKLQTHQLFLILEDVPFELAKETLTFTEVVDASDKTLGLDAKGGVVMSSETYKRIDSWNVLWRRRF